MNASAPCTRVANPTRCRCCWTFPIGTKKNRRVFFNLSGFIEVDQGLVELHKQAGAVCYCEMGSFYSLYADDPEVKLESRTEDGVFSTRISTPLGAIYEERVFNPDSYSYGIRKYLLQSTDEFPIVEFLMDRLQCRPKWELYRAWQESLGELAYPYAQLPYSGSGYLMSRNMGVERTVVCCLRRTRTSPTVGQGSQRL